MDDGNDDLQNQLIICRSILSKGYTNKQISRLPWLNTFCLELYKFSKKLHIFLSLLDEKQKHEKSDYIEMIYLCLTQIVTCIEHMENTLKAENQLGAAISAARQHFLDRIHWCFGRLHSCLNSINSEHSKIAKPLENNSFVELMDGVLDVLALYSSYNNEIYIEKNINVAQNQAQALFDSQEIRAMVDLVLGHTLAFANVALQEDKKALSAICQKVLRVCMEFQDECSNSMLPEVPFNESNRRLKAISLENALIQLEDYINEALLRLVFTCFLDFNRFSVDKLRQQIREKESDDSELDELIADFDVNTDRATQMGTFAIWFAPNVKIKTIMRSCLASFEALDSCIIPSLQTKGSSDVFSRILEQHFNEEVTIFKNCILEIIDSHSIATSYLEILTQTIQMNDKQFNKNSLQEILAKAEFLYQHFQLPTNYKLLEEEAKRLELLKKIYLMVQECHAALKYPIPVLEPPRVLKRFKILRSVLKQLIEEIKENGDAGVDNTTQLCLMADELTNDSQEMFSSLNITPSNTSILYDNSKQLKLKRQHLLNNDSIKANCSKLATPPDLTPDPAAAVATDARSVNAVPQQAEPQRINTTKNFPLNSRQRGSIRRKESLRTALFKRQKSCETQQIYNVYKNNSDSLQISEILDQLTDLSSNLSKHVLDKSFIS